MRASAALRAMVFLLGGIGCLLSVGGCPRPTSPGADATTVKESSQVDNAGERSAADSSESAESRNEEKSSADSSQADGQKTSRNPTGVPGPNSESGGAAGGGAGESAPGSGGARGSGARGGSGVPGSGAGGEASPTPSGRSLPGRNAAVQRARDALAQSGKGDTSRSYQAMVEAWQGLQGFTENDGESAALAAQLLKEMERLGAGLDRNKRPTADKPLIAE